MHLTAVLIPAPEGGYTALNPETGTASQGETIKEALANLKEATQLYLEDFPMSAFEPSFVTSFDVAVSA